MLDPAAFEARAGVVTAVKLHEGENGARSAHIVFADAAGLKKALGLASKPKPLELAAGGGPSGGSKLAATTATPTRAALQEAVGEFMQRFEADEAARKEEEEARHNQMDADGFVLVTRKRSGRSTTTDASTGAKVGVATAGMERHIADEVGGDDADGGGGKRGRKKKKSKEMTDFYHFQAHEKKREGLMRLREQFEADKARIAKMRADRKFKPQGYTVQMDAVE